MKYENYWKKKERPQWSKKWMNLNLLSYLIRNSCIIRIFVRESLGDWNTDRLSAPFGVDWFAATGRQKWKFCLSA